MMVVLHETRNFNNFSIRHKMLRVCWLVRLLTIYVHVLISLSAGHPGPDVLWNFQAFAHLEAKKRKEKKKKNSNIILEENI